MQFETSLPEDVRGVASQSARDLAGFVETLDHERTSASLRSATDRLGINQALSLSAFKQALTALLTAGAEHLANDEVAEAGHALFRATALIEAKAAAVEMAALTAARADFSGFAVSVSAAPTASLPAMVTGLLGKLKKLGQWIVAVIQSLLTPKSWSISGGISLGFLSSAQLSIEFGP
ncbi:hypothetical protein CCR85_03425 [Rhodothalassium salexigens]|uniref:hypothetical protein n=1 Tax=Rhodothalassium salexigens TaxID=1086 RepID=UPI001912B83E|nr:hypothetical protein [Rhodothalassium salexigens]MBK5910542.1 hypothetical protein [Rhodothalassium salexigens]MBK5919871.1 hypothetical protein [Rhodothalassium salexigens]